MNVGDELTLEQLQQLADTTEVQTPTDEVPDEGSLDDLNSLVSEGFSVPDEGSLEDLNRVAVAATLSGHHSDRLAADFGKGPVTMAQAANTLKAKEEYFRADRGWLDTAAYYLSIPQQAMTRQAVNILENMGNLSTEEAKMLLSRDELLPSDIVNYYWKDNTNKGWRFTAGLAADIILDPLNVIGVGVLGKAGKAAAVAGRELKNLDKVSTAARRWIKGVESVEKIITKEGKITEATQQNVAKLLDKQIGADEFLKTLPLPEAKLAKVEQELQKAITAPSWADEWIEGSRGFGIGINIPFTRIAWETELPFGNLGINKLTGYGLKGVGEVFDLPRKALMQFPQGQMLWDSLRDIKTRTGKYIFDSQQAGYAGAIEKRKYDLTQMEKVNRRTLEAIRKRTGDERKFTQLINDIVEEMEMRPLSLEEAGRVADEFNKSQTQVMDLLDDYGRPKQMDVQSLDLARLTTPTARDTERAARLARYPEAEQIIEDLMDINRQSVEAYKARGIPFQELNPFGEGWSRRYIKHLITNDWFNYAKQVDDGETEIAKALDYLNRNVGGVETKEAGRAYRKTIQEANAETMEKLGIKIFVDDPLELVSRRAMEMERVVQAHDLMQAASAYGVKGAHPGPGWVKFDINKFRNLVMDDVGKGDDAVKAFVPKYFQTSDSIYLPSDIYDRMLFQINGHDFTTAPGKIIKILEPYNNLFRKTALMGPGYLGQNLFGNMAMFLNHNGLGGVPALVDATKAMLGSGEIALKNPDGSSYLMKAEDLFAEAVEDNILISGLSGELKFSDLAENIASNRENVKSKWGKLETLADYAYFWRFNRYIAEKSDQIPKLATYINRRASGFTREAAAEAADRYFYTFNLGSRQMDYASRIVPFSKFPMKTLEYVMSELKTGGLNKLAVPGKVNNVLMAEYAPNAEVRQALDQQIPDYQAIKAPIHGDILPGAREVVLEMPWAANTLSTVFNPTNSVHPALQLFQAASSYWGSDEEYRDLKGDDLTKILRRNAEMFMPWWFSDWATAKDIEDGRFGGFFASEFQPKLPTPRQQEQYANPADDALLLDLPGTVTQFKNAAKFGDAVQDKWLYKLFFEPTEGGNDIDDQKLGAKGEFIRRKFKDLNLGLASLNKLDNNVLFNALAIKRQIKRHRDSLQSDLLTNQKLFDNEKILEPEYLENMAETYPQARELLRLMGKQQALREYYNYFLQLDEKEPNLDPLGAIFGVDSTRMDHSEAPMVYDLLTQEASDFTEEAAKNIQSQILEDVTEDRDIEPEFIETEASTDNVEEDDDILDQINTIFEDGAE